MQELTHFIDGKRVKGTSGRFADVFYPAFVPSWSVHVLETGYVAAEYEFTTSGTVRTRKASTTTDRMSSCSPSVVR